MYNFTHQFQLAYTLLLQGHSCDDYVVELSKELSRRHTVAEEQKKQAEHIWGQEKTRLEKEVEHHKILKEQAKAKAERDIKEKTRS